MNCDEDNMSLDGTKYLVHVNSQYLHYQEIFDINIMLQFLGWKNSNKLEIVESLV